MLNLNELLVRQYEVTVATRRGAELVVSVAASAEGVAALGHDGSRHDVHLSSTACPRVSALTYRPRTQGMLKFVR
jgi:hypothetical protein